MTGQTHQDRIHGSRLKTGVTAYVVSVSPLLRHLQECIKHLQRLGGHPGLHADKSTYVDVFVKRPSETVVRVAPSRRPPVLGLDFATRRRGGKKAFAE